MLIEDDSSLSGLDCPDSGMLLSCFIRLRILSSYKNDCLLSYVKSREFKSVDFYYKLSLKLV